MKINLGVNNGYAAKRWPEPDVWGSQVAGRWGLKHVQFSFDLLDPRCSKSARDSMCEEIKKASLKYGFEMQNAFIGGGAYAYNLLLHPFVEFRKDAMKWCELAVLTSEQMGSKGVGGPIAALSVESLKDAARKEYLIESFVEAMRYMARFAAAHKQEYILWEPTPIEREISFSIDETYKIYKRLNKDVPIPIHLCFDVGHQCGGMKGRDLDTYTWLAELGRFSPVIHLQQSDGIWDRHWPMTREFNEKGIVKMDKVLEILDKSGLKEVSFFTEIIFPFEYDESILLEDMDETFKYLKQFV